MSCSRKAVFKDTSSLDLVEYTCDLNIEKEKQGDSEFKASLSYIGNLRLAWSTGDPIIIVITIKIIIQKYVV